MRRPASTLIACALLLGSAAAPAAAMNMSLHLHQGAARGTSFHRPPLPGGHGLHARVFAGKPPGALPQSRKSCFRRRLRQLLQLGHDLDLAEEEALLICG